MPAPRPFPPVHEAVRPTVWVEAPRLSERLGAIVTLASETFQHTGSFKFRAAYHVAASVPQDRLLAGSSGNFGQALAYACRQLGKSCTVVMPDNSARTKIEAVRAFGGKVDLVDVRSKSRQTRVAELAALDPEVYVASPFDDPLVIEGNATLGRELAAGPRGFDFVLAAVGGGGLTSGLLIGLRRAGCATPVIGAEPLLANDAARSLRAGQLLANEKEPATIADGARTLSLGRHNWEILRRDLHEIIEVTDDQIREAVRVVFSLASLVAEPTGASSVAALLARPDRFAGRSVCCVISGGNVDAKTFAEIITGY